LLGVWQKQDDDETLDINFDYSVLGGTSRPG
jgi:hypothetical protein